MNKTFFLISTLLVSSFIGLSAGFVVAQVPDVPKPQCVSTPEIPCPGDKKMYELNKVQKVQNLPVVNSNTNISKTFEYLSANITKLTDLLKLKYIEMVNRFKNFYDNFKKK